VADDVKRLASFIPKSERLALFKQLYELCESNAQKTARILGINPRQIYFYLPNNGRKVRNYPNDETTSLILRAILKKDPTITAQKMNRILGEFTVLLERLHLDDGEAGRV